MANARIDRILAFLDEVILKDPIFNAKYGRQFAALQAISAPSEEDSNSVIDFSDVFDSPESPPPADKGIAVAATQLTSTETSIVSAPIVPAPIVSKTMATPQLRTAAASAQVERMDTSVPLDNTSPSSHPPSDNEDASSSSTTSDDDYEVVAGKRKKAKSSSQASKAKKAVASSPSAPAVSIPASSRPSSPVVASRAPASASSKKLKPPPPLYIQDKAKWTEVSKWCNDRKITYTNARATQQGIKVQVPSSKDHRELTSLLKVRNVSFHTYSLPEEAPTRVVIRRIPKEIPAEDILSDLRAQNVPVTAVHRLHKARGGPAYDTVLVVCEPTDGHHPIFQVKAVCSLSGISIEKPYKSNIVGQCHRCQLYGHVQRNCFATPRCVKCLGEHGTADCPRPKDRGLCTEPPSCVLCGQSGHPANYRGCPKAPKSSSPKLTKRANARQQRESPSATRIPSSKMPERLSPQRPSPWTPLNHQRAFPALAPAQPAKAAPIPALMASVVPAPAPAAKTSPPPKAPAPQTPRAPRPVASAPAPDFDAVGIISEAWKIYSNPDAIPMAREIIACGADIKAIGAVFLAYPAITSVLHKLHRSNHE